METLGFDRKKLQSKCDEPLMTAYIRKRKGDKGNLVSYLEANYVVRGLNKIFPLGWSRRVGSHAILCEEKTNKGQWEVTAECEMTIEIHPHGEVIASHTDIGIGKSFASKLGVARGQAVKNSYTDAIKRCAKTLGFFFGLGLSLSEDTAEAIGALQVSSKHVDVFSEDGPRVSKNFPWLDAGIYGELLDFHKENKGDTSAKIPVTLRNKVVSETESVFRDTFGMDASMYDLLAGQGVSNAGRSLPTFEQMKDFLVQFTSLLSGEIALEEILTETAEASAVPPPSVTAEEAESYERKKMFSGVRGYVVIGTRKSHTEEDGDVIDVKLAIPKEEAIVYAKLYCDSEDYIQFLHTTGVFSRYDNAAKEVAANSSLLNNVSGFAEFRERDDKVEVSSWKELEATMR